jgi:hypothetical protein
MGWKVRFRFLRVEDFFLLHIGQTGSGAHQAFHIMGTGGEADHSPLSRAEVKIGGAIPPLPYMFS